MFKASMILAIIYLDGRFLVDSVAGIAQLVCVAVAIVFLLANLVWLIERRHNKQFQKPYLRVIGEGLWVTMLIIATGEHGEREAPGFWKRVLVPAMWLIGVVLIAQLTATVTSSQTVARLQSNIRGPDDLPGKTIGTVPGTTAADYLARRGLASVDVNSAADGIRCSRVVKYRRSSTTRRRYSTGPRSAATAC
ncbi:hypothetical protein [Caballeronia sp. GaOx3]|uniref:hypothetical protein n=1 Tax=Caballeronia sp. GaOx3 TaxID=2921740 RepID=UPI0020287EB1|nr:hypothetical protein [Caballeronia sp. GaOx3]